MSDSPFIDRSPRQAGFSLIETLLGLTMIGVGLLFAFAAMLQHSQAVNRISGHEVALRALDSALEDLRGGADSALLVGQPTTTDGRDSTDGQLGNTGLPTLQVVSEITPASTNGLYRVRLTARYTIAGRSFERRLDSLLWRPTS